MLVWERFIFIRLNSNAGNAAGWEKATAHAWRSGNISEGLEVHFASALTSLWLESCNLLQKETSPQTASVIVLRCCF